MTKVKYFVYDTETSGIDTNEDRIVQFFGATADEDGNLVDTWEVFINPGIPVPEAASDIHGFTDEFLQENGRDPVEALTDIKNLFLKYRHLIQVAFNMNYDLSILDTEFKRHGVSDTFGSYMAKHGKLVDGLVIDRYKDKYRKGKRNLETQAKHYGVDFNPDELHNARADVELTAKVTVKILEKFGTPTTQEQAQWREAWRSNFESYLRKTDPEAVVEKGWPLRLTEDKK